MPILGKQQVSLCTHAHIHTHTHTDLQERLERIRNFRPEDLADLHPHLGERMARSSEEVRSRLEEARRMTVEDMRNLQKCVCVCVCACVRACVHVCVRVCAWVVGGE